MVTAPGRGSSEGAIPTASVTALLRVPAVPGGAEVSGFGIRERLIALTVHARRQGPGMKKREMRRSRSRRQKASWRRRSACHWPRCRDIPEDICLKEINLRPSVFRAMLT